MDDTLTLPAKPDSGGGSCVTLAEAKTQCDVETTDHDGLLTRLTTVATDYIERRLQRQLVTATWTGSLTGFPKGRNPIVVPRPPLISITSVDYTDEDGNPQTLATTEYEDDTDREPGLVVLKPDKFWPATQPGKWRPVTVTFDAGFGAAAAVPEDIRHAVLMVLRFWFENREAELVGSISKELEFSVAALASTWEIPVIG